METHGIYTFSNLNRKQIVFMKVNLQCNFLNFKFKVNDDENKEPSTRNMGGRDQYFRILHCEHKKRLQALIQRLPFDLISTSAGKTGCLNFVPLVWHRTKKKDQSEKVTSLDIWNDKYWYIVQLVGESREKKHLAVLICGQQNLPNRKGWLNFGNSGHTLNT